ncbi:MAG: hypothetical protein K2Z81_17825 [Cyanobacteria bacterium]|nr:hypothetical protein [Cyanobacteriota bacterium]
MSLSTKILCAATVISGSCLPSVVAQTEGGTGIQKQVRVSEENGLITTIFQTPSGGRVSAYLPLNVASDEGEVGGTVERQLAPGYSNSSPQQAEEVSDELSGVVTIVPKKEKSSTPVVCPPDKPSFTCKPPDDCTTYDITYIPPKGTPCTATITCPPRTHKPDRPKPNTCTIPQLSNCGGSMFVNMPCPENNPDKGTCFIGGTRAPLRAWSRDGCVFHVPPASELPPGANSVIVSRGGQTATGQTHCAQVKVTCTPNKLKPGQPCTITTTVNCPGMSSIKNGVITIKNYDPDVLKMPDRTIPIPYRPASAASTNDLLKRDARERMKRVKEKLQNGPKTAKTEKYLNLIQSLEQKL